MSLIPTRYPGSETSDDDQIIMARKTDWVEREGGLFVGLGQRMLATDEGEHAILEAGTIAFDNEIIEEQPSQEAGDG